MKNYFYYFLFPLVIFAQQEVSITTPKGEIKGLWTNQEHQIAVFKGIPYAQSTAGQQRWKPPITVPEWEGILEATTFGPSCPQINASSYWKKSNVLMSEDCLRLNIWTNALNQVEKKPVMVWIHGGGLNTGNGHVWTYNGAQFAAQDIVLVTINYRLGALGFLAHPLLSEEADTKTSGNYGFLDQLLALKWVQENIQSFGGDPNNVTVFGESAGATSVSVLAASPLSKGLFHKAIIQSPWMFGYINNIAEPNVIYLKKDKMGYSSAESYGFEWTQKHLPKNVKDSLSYLRNVSVDSILFKDTYYKTKVTIDNWLLNGHPESEFLKGNQRSIPMLLGSNSDEGTFFWYTINFTSLEDFTSILTPFFTKQAQSIATHYFKSYSGGIPNKGASYITDSWFVEPTIQMLKGHSKYQPNTYQYQFSYSNPKRPEFGASHAAEIKYVFGNLSADALEEEKELSQQMIHYWTQFAKTGNPNKDGLPFWPKFDLEKQIYLDFNTDLSAKKALKSPLIWPMEKAKKAIYKAASF